MDHVYSNSISSAIDVHPRCLAGAHPSLDLADLKLRSFSRILAAEEAYLPDSKAMIAHLRSGIEEMARR